MIHALFWGFARIFATFGFVAYVVSPLWDWLGGDGWEVTSDAYVRAATASVLMLAFELKRFKRSRLGSNLR